MTGLRTVTASAYEKMHTFFGIVQRDSIFNTLSSPNLPLMGDRDCSLLHNLDKGRDLAYPVLLSLAAIPQVLPKGYSGREIPGVARVGLEVKYAPGMPMICPGLHNGLYSLSVVVPSYETVQEGASSVTFFAWHKRCDCYRKPRTGCKIASHVCPRLDYREDENQIMANAALRTS